MAINSEHDGTVPDNCFCPVCNAHMNLIKKSRPIDIHQAHKTISSNGIKERWHLKDNLQTLRTDFQQTMNRNKEKLLKLNPYLILDTDPTLDDFNYSNVQSRYSHPFSK